MCARSWAHRTFELLACVLIKYSVAIEIMCFSRAINDGGFRSCFVEARACDMGAVNVLRLVVLFASIQKSVDLVVLF